MSDIEMMARDEAQGHFLALADLLREMGNFDLLGRLAELYMDFRQTDFSHGSLES